MTGFYDRTVDDALDREELDHLKPSTEELFENTRRATMWYNEAVWTAAALFVEAAEQSDRFRKTFMSEESEEVTVGDTTVDMEKWRSALEKELPEYHEKIMGIGLSAFQGGNAEQVARRHIERNL